MVKKIWIPTSNVDPTTAAASAVSGAYWDDAGDGVATTGLPNDVEMRPYVLSAAGPVGTPSAVLWTPADTDGAGTPMAGISIWYDPSDAASRTVSGSEITGLTDKSGNLAHATREFATGPTLVSGASPSGLDWMDVGTDNALTFDSPPASGDVARATFIVLGPDSADRTPWCFGNSRRWGMRSYDDAGTRRWEVFENGSTPESLFSDIPADAGGVIGAMHDGTASWSGVSVSDNGDFDDTFSSVVTVNTSNEANGWRLGGRWVGTGVRGGPLGEFIQFWGRDLSANTYHATITDREYLEGYIHHKWGYANLLPAGHPHKSSPPTV